MLTRLSLQNFKAWDRLPDAGFGSITGLFGTNSSGKTSILDFFLLLKQTIESPDRRQTIEFGGDSSYVQLGSFQDVIHAHDVERVLKFQVGTNLRKQLDVKGTEGQSPGVVLSGDTLTFEAEIAQTKARRLFVQQMAYSFGGHRFRLRKQEADRYDYKLTSEKLPGTANKFSILRPPGRAWALPEPDKFHGFPEQIRTYYLNVGFLFDIQLAFENAFSNIYYLGPLRSYPKRQYTWTGARPGDMGRAGERFVDALLASRETGELISRGKGKRRFSLEQYVAYWLKELSLVYDFQISEIAEGSNIYQVRVQKTPNSSPVAVTDVGFGVSQILPVLTLCYYVPRGSTVIIEQPEIHLHPSVQAGLADVLIDAVRVRNIQIVLESHSEYLLRRLQRRIAEGAVSNREINLYFTSNSRGSSQLTPLDVDIFGSIQNWPQGFFGDEMEEIAKTNAAILERKLTDRG